MLLLRHPDQAETRAAIFEHARSWYIELRAIKETLDHLGRSSMPFPFGMGPRG
jgi:hypothetical protein